MHCYPCQSQETRPEGEIGYANEPGFAAGVTSAEILAAGVRLDADLDDDLGWGDLRVVCWIVTPDGATETCRVYSVEAFGLHILAAIRGEKPRWERCSRPRSRGDTTARDLWESVASAELRAATDLAEQQLDAEIVDEEELAYG